MNASSPLVPYTRLTPLFVARQVMVSAMQSIPPEEPFTTDQFLRLVGDILLENYPGMLIGYGSTRDFLQAEIGKKTDLRTTNSNHVPGSTKSGYVRSETAHYSPWTPRTTTTVPTNEALAAREKVIATQNTAIVEMLQTRGVKVTPEALANPVEALKKHLNERSEPAKNDVAIVLRDITGQSDDKAALEAVLSLRDHAAILRKSLVQDSDKDVELVVRMLQEGMASSINDVNELIQIVGIDDRGDINKNLRGVARYIQNIKPQSEEVAQLRAFLRLDEGDRLIDAVGALRQDPDDLIDVIWEATGLPLPAPGTYKLPHILQWINHTKETLGKRGHSDTSSPVVGVNTDKPADDAAQQNRAHVQALMDTFSPTILQELMDTVRGRLRSVNNAPRTHQSPVRITAEVDGEPSLHGVFVGKGYDCAVARVPVGQLHLTNECDQFSPLTCETHNLLVLVAWSDSPDPMVVDVLPAKGYLATVPDQ